MIQIGELTISECPHGGLWIARDDGEGMQVMGETLEKLGQALEEFWTAYF